MSYTEFYIQPKGAAVFTGEDLDNKDLLRADWDDFGFLFTSIANALAAHSD